MKTASVNAAKHKQSTTWADPHDIPWEVQSRPSRSITVENVINEMPQRSSFFREVKGGATSTGGESRSRVLTTRQRMQIGRFKMKHCISIHQPLLYFTKRRLPLGNLLLTHLQLACCDSTPDNTGPRADATAQVAPMKPWYFPLFLFVASVVQQASSHP